MQKIVSIVGPTATGKTNAALKMSASLINDKKVSGVDIISADSRQIYKGLELTTGADVPSNFTISNSPQHQYPFYKHKDKTISLHGISIINPDEEWSVAHFRDFAQSIIKNNYKKNRAIIIVGGTGLYHQHLFSQDNTLNIKPDIKLRKKAESLSVEELQNWLGKIDDNKLKKMNNSDKNNPRRLIRAIEIAEIKEKNNLETALQPDHKFDHSIHYLSNSLENISKSITKRVKERFDNGSIKEVQNLYKKYNDTSLPAFTATGVKEIHSFLIREISEKKALENWALREFQYAKRQITWWRKNQE